ncbi:MAG: hypothetical protein RRC34_04565 [Lentisphaeria bacterium]|nr:hypothetical protein [Lentisphaeria bacterium]
MSEQLFLDFFAQSAADGGERVSETGDNDSVSEASSRLESSDRIPVSLEAGGKLQATLRRAVLRWLEKAYRPQGMMVSVPTRSSKFKADVAAFWNRPVSNRSGVGPRSLARPSQTLIVECFTSRAQCRLDCAETGAILAELNRKRRLREELQATIRQREPALRCSEALFEEYAEWNYHQSTDPEYKQVEKDIRRLQEALGKGTRFERIQSAAVADCLFAAVPAGLIQASELADAWGLLWIHDDMDVTVKKQAEIHPVEEANRMHFIQNIAAAAKTGFLATQGVRRGTGEDVYFVKQARLHRKRQIISFNSDQL